ncbi:MAG: hypothetical protein AAF493_24465 [Pseudomonadota bacterium]
MIKTPLPGIVDSFRLVHSILWITMVFFTSGSAFATTVIFSQDFNSPVGWEQVVIPVAALDVSQQPVNDLYGAHTSGVSYAQGGTVETLHVTGGEAFGTGYDDPSGEAGDYLLAMLRTDLLGISLSIGAVDSFHLSIDITSIDINGAGGPFNPPNGRESMFQISLFDNPSGAANTGSGTALDFVTGTTTLSATNVIDFTTLTHTFDATGVTNGNVILQIDLIGSCAI